MGTVRHHTRVNRPAADVWAIVTDAGDISWMEGVDSCSMEGDIRTLETMGMEIQEQIVTNDPELRRLQYVIMGGAMVPEHHIATIDVIEDGDGSLLIYGCDIKPDELVGIFDGICAGAMNAIKARAES